MLYDRLCDVYFKEVKLRSLTDQKLPKEILDLLFAVTAEILAAMCLNISLETVLEVGSII
jgi:hypothetical protein